MNIGINDYLKAALDWVIDICAENGLKYRYGDFRVTYRADGITFLANNTKAKNAMYFRGTVNEPKGIGVTLTYECERMGKRVKAQKNSFYNYSFCRVEPDGQKCIEFFFTSAELDVRILGTTDSDDAKIASVIEKVKKLLAKADLEKNPSEAEALAASMMAQKLLAKYNLEIEDVTGKPKEEEISQIITDVGTGNKWKYDLAEVVARSYCCKCYYVGHDKIVFYGYKSDALIARRVYMYLFSVGNKLARGYVKDYRANHGYCPDGLYNDYVTGFKDGIDKELSRQCKALVLVVPTKVTEAYNDFTKDFGSMNTSVSGGGNRDAYLRGEADGRSALNAQYIEKGGKMELSAHGAQG